MKTLGLHVPQACVTYWKRGERLFPKATLPDSHTDFAGLLTDGCDTAVAPAWLLVVTGGRSHITEFTQLWKLEGTIVVGDHHIIINCGGKRYTEWLSNEFLPMNSWGCYAISNERDVGRMNTKKDRMIPAPICNISPCRVGWILSYFLLLSMTS